MTGHRHAEAGSRTASDLLPGLVTVALGSALLWIVGSGQFERYVRTWQRWPLAATGVLCIAAGAVALRRPHAHGAGTGTAWLAAGLALPVIVIAGLQPPPLGAAAALLRQASTPPPPGGAFRPIPPWPDPPTLTLGDFTERALYDGTDTLRGRTVRLVGFVMRDPDTPGALLLARFRIVCCAADAELVQVRLEPSAPLRFRPGTWIAVTGTLAPPLPGRGQAALRVATASSQGAPLDAYE